MSMFKVSVIRTDGIQHESTFSGWNAEPALIHFSNMAKGDPKTLLMATFEGVKSERSADIVWTARGTYNGTKPNA